MNNSAFDRFSKLEQKSERTKLVISRHWDNPEIQITIDEKKIVLFTDIGDFLKAISSEIEKPMTFTRASLEQKISDAAFKAIEKIKQTTTQVM